MLVHEISERYSADHHHNGALNRGEFELIITTTLLSILFVKSANDIELINTSTLFTFLTVDYAKDIELDVTPTMHLNLSN